MYFIEIRIDFPHLCVHAVRGPVDVYKLTQLWRNSLELLNGVIYRLKHPRQHVVHRLISLCSSVRNPLGDLLLHIGFLQLRDLLIDRVC